jgi:hypothetical protein
MDRREIDTVFVCQHPARIDGGGLRPFGNADALAGEVFRLCDAGIAADVDRRVAEHARRKHRNRNEAPISWAARAAILPSDTSETSNSPCSRKR